MDAIDYLSKDDVTRQNYLIDSTTGSYGSEIFTDGGEVVNEDSEEIYERDEIEGAGLPGVLAASSAATSLPAVLNYSLGGTEYVVGDASGTAISALFGFSSVALGIGAVGAYLESVESDDMKDLEEKHLEGIDSEAEEENLEG